MSTVLIIDDNEGICTALTVLLRLHDIKVLSANSPEAGLEILEHSEVQLVIQDMNFTGDTTSGAEGERLFEKIRALYPSLPIVLLTAWTHLETAVELVKKGAADYLAKPWDDEKLLTTVRNLLQLQAAQESREIDLRKAKVQRDELTSYDLCGLVFESQEVLQLVQTAVQVARADVPVLITGPNGAGKEKIAEIVHANSGRTGKLVKVNAGALPHDLIESELFGSEAGAFTGAQKRQGRFEMADGGTLFLDEIGNLPLQGQIKLLRVLQTGEFEPLGSSTTKKVDVRIITATNSDLASAISAGQFREDLYYRINLITLAVPSLNQRSADILPLANHFLDGSNALEEDAVRVLMDYHWPGNVRELENCMKRAMLVSPGKRIGKEQLGLEQLGRGSSANGGPAGISGEASVEDIEQALQAYNGVVSRAARSLGLSRQALYRRMEKYGIK